MKRDRAERSCRTRLLLRCVTAAGNHWGVLSRSRRHVATSWKCEHLGANSDHPSKRKVLWSGNALRSFRSVGFFVVGKRPCHALAQPAESDVAARAHGFLLRKGCFLLRRHARPVDTSHGSYAAFIRI